MYASLLSNAISINHARVRVGVRQKGNSMHTSRFYTHAVLHSTVRRPVIHGCFALWSLGHLIDEIASMKGLKTPLILSYDRTWILMINTCKMAVRICFGGYI